MCVAESAQTSFVRLGRGEKLIIFFRLHQLNELNMGTHFYHNQNERKIKTSFQTVNPNIENHTESHRLKRARHIMRHFRTATPLM